MPSRILGYSGQVFLRPPYADLTDRVVQVGQGDTPLFVIETGLVPIGNIAYQADGNSAESVKERAQQLGDDFRGEVLDARVHHRLGELARVGFVV